MQGVRHCAFAQTGWVWLGVGSISSAPDHKRRINLEVAFALLHKHRLVLDESLSFAHTIRGKSVLRGVGKKDWGLEGKGEGH